MCDLVGHMFSLASSSHKTKYVTVVAASLARFWTQREKLHWSPEECSRMLLRVTKTLLSPRWWDRLIHMAGGAGFVVFKHPNCQPSTPPLFKIISSLWEKDWGCMSCTSPLAFRPFDFFHSYDSGHLLYTWEFIWVCLHVCVRACVPVCPCTCTYVKIRGQPWLSFLRWSTPNFFFFEIGLLMVGVL